MELEGESAYRCAHCPELLRWNWCGIPHDKSVGIDD